MPNAMARADLVTFTVGIPTLLKMEFEGGSGTEISV